VGEGRQGNEERFATPHVEITWIWSGFGYWLWDGTDDAGPARRVSGSSPQMARDSICVLLRVAPEITIWRQARVAVAN
jgi:hypothetical protein